MFNWWYADLFNFIWMIKICALSVVCFLKQLFKIKIEYMASTINTKQYFTHDKEMTKSTREKSAMYILRASVRLYQQITLDLCFTFISKPQWEMKNKKSYAKRLLIYIDRINTIIKFNNVELLVQRIAIIHHTQHNCIIKQFRGYQESHELLHDVEMSVLPHL